MVVLYLVFAVGAAVLAVSSVRRRWRFTDTPTSDAAHVFPGLNEVHGVVEPIGPPALAASDGARCVWWEYKVERKQQDKNGSRWITEEHGVTALPFLVRDQSGAVRVEIDDSVSVAGTGEADLEHLSLDFLRPYARVMKDTYTPGTLTVFGKTFGNETREPISAFGGSWRARERRLCVGERVFVAGHARLTPGGEAVEVARTDEQGDRHALEITVGDEKAAMANHAPIPAALIGAVVSLVMFALASAAMFGSPVVLPLVALVGAVVLFGVGVWNRVRRARERCMFAWSLIDVACEQRSNLVPQLQTVVGAALAHERSLLEAVAAARALGRRPSAAAVGTVQAADAASDRVVALVEAAPTLRTQANVAQMMQQVTVLNDRVAFGRRFYNDSVQRLADRIGQFPDSLAARLGGVVPLPYIEEPAARELPPPTVR